MKRKRELTTQEQVDTAVKLGDKLIDKLALMRAANFRQTAPRFEILRIDEMLFAVQEKIRKYKQGEKEEKRK